MPREHPHLIGTRARLQKLAENRPQEYQRMAGVARNADADDYARMMSMALVVAVEKDPELGKEAVKLAMKYVNGPIRKGHVPFAADLALCAMVYDMCYEYWTQTERAACHEYLNKTVDANVDSETHVFHNGWYGYKHWGIGLAAYAMYYENPRAVGILKGLRDDYGKRAAPALNFAGGGGGWAEGYYVNYWIYEWLFFCEAARHCEGIDYYADAPRFYNSRAVASMFESYPGIGIYNSRRPVPMGDGGGRVFGGDRDKVLSSRRILASYFSADPASRAVHAFNETTPRSSVGLYAYKDFLWHDAAMAKADLGKFKLSHIATGPGYVYARSSWDEDATYFFFKCGDRFTAHQHLDVGHFNIYKCDELAGDGGHYDGFGTVHDVNYHLRTIAHSTILVRDPAEKWRPDIRGGDVTSNDGGQSYAWPHHNGAVVDMADWKKNEKLYDIGDIKAFEDRGAYMYVGADCTRAYSQDKLSCFTRRIVFLRPDTFVIFDKVTSKDPSLRKTWLLQAMQVPERTGSHLVITNGKGRLFVQPVLPAGAEVRMVSGNELYSYDGHSYPPARDTGPAPACRIEVSPKQAAGTDYFLNVLTAASAGTDTVPVASVRDSGSDIAVTLGETLITFAKDGVAGTIKTSSGTIGLATTIKADAVSQ